MLYHWATRALWCPEPESNQWHVDFQSTALPTELSGRKKYFYEAARDRDRTGTGVTPQDFKSCASANSATRANLALFQPLNYYTKPAEICQQLFSIFFIFHHQSLGKKKNKYLYLFWKWAEKDSNLRSYRNRFTVCPLWPLGNPPMVMESFFDYELPTHDALGIVQGSEWKMMEWFSSVKKKNRP